MELSLYVRTTGMANVIREIPASTVTQPNVLPTADMVGMAAVVDSMNVNFSIQFYVEILLIKANVLIEIVPLLTSKELFVIIVV